MRAPGASSRWPDFRSSPKFGELRHGEVRITREIRSSTSENAVKAKFPEGAHLPHSPGPNASGSGAGHRAFSTECKLMFALGGHPPSRISIHRCYKL